MANLVNERALGDFFLCINNILFFDTEDFELRNLKEQSSSFHLLQHVIFAYIFLQFLILHRGRVHLDASQLDGGIF